MKNTLRTVVGRSLQSVGLRGVARRIEKVIRPARFRPDSLVTPQAVERALKISAERNPAVEGDYFEFGIYRGYTLWYAQKVAAALGHTSMRFVGFDSFQGFPEVKGVDSYQGDFVRGQFSASQDDVRHALTRHGVDWTRTILVPGYFESTLTPALKRRHRLRTAAVVLVDCVLYESTVLVLSFLQDLLRNGSILIFDDWNAFDADDGRGERRAFGEFLVANADWDPEPLFDYGAYGQAFAMRRRHPS